MAETVSVASWEVPSNNVRDATVSTLLEEIFDRFGQEIFPFRDPAAATLALLRLLTVGLFIIVVHAALLGSYVGTFVTCYIAISVSRFGFVRFFDSVASARIVKPTTTPKATQADATAAVEGGGDIITPSTTPIAEPTSNLFVLAMVTFAGLISASLLGYRTAEEESIVEIDVKSSIPPRRHKNRQRAATTSAGPSPFDVVVPPTEKPTPIDVNALVITQ